MGNLTAGHKGNRAFAVGISAIGVLKHAASNPGDSISLVIIIVSHVLSCPMSLSKTLLKSHLLGAVTTTSCNPLFNFLPFTFTVASPALLREASVQDSKGW